MAMRSGVEHGSLGAHGTVESGVRAGAVRRGALLVAGASLLALLVSLDVPLCPTAALFGLPCPGCGLTRGALRLARGDLGGALAFHPLSLVLVPLALGLVSKAALTYVRGTRPSLATTPRSARFTTLAGYALLAALLFVWLARFLGAFGGPVPVSSPGRAFIERTLGR